MVIGAIAVDWLTIPETVYAGTGEGNGCQDCLPGQGVLKSIDGGATWVLLGQSTFAASSVRFESMAIDSNTLGVTETVYGATDHGLYVSTNGGSTWTVSLAGGVNVVQEDPSAPGTFWAAQADDCKTEPGSIWKKVVAGLWTQKLSVAPQVMRFGLGVGVGGVAYALMSDCAGKLLGIIKTTDGGASWQTTTQPTDPFVFLPSDSSGQGWYDNVVAVDPYDPTGDTAAFGGVTMLATRDGGSSFTDVAQPYNGGPLHPDFHAIQFIARNTFLTGNDGGVWYTADLGGTAQPGDWSDLSATLSITQFYGGSAVDLGHLTGGSQDNGTAGIMPGGPATPAWASLLDGDGIQTAMIPGQASFFTAATALDLWKVNASNPMNPTVTEIAPCLPPSCTDRVGFAAPFVMDPTSTDPSTARLYGGTYRVYRTSTGGIASGNTPAWTVGSGDLTTGTTINPGSAGGDWIHAMAIGAGSTSNTLATGSWFGKVWMTRTAQTATASTGWSDITGTGGTALPAFDPANHTSNAWISGVAVNPLDDHEAWVTIGRLNGGRIYHTTSAGGLPGTTWTDISTTLPPNLVVDTITVDPLKPLNLYIGTDLGTMICTFCGGSAPFTDSWVPLGTGMPTVRVDQITLTHDDQNLVAWTHGRGAWTIARPIPTPGATLTPSLIDFGHQNVGTTSAVKQAVLRSSGTGPLTVNSIAAGGDFAIVNSSTAGHCPSTSFVLAPGISCAIDITFTPSLEGAQNATLSVTDDAPTSPQTSTLAGTGTKPAASLMPDHLDFGGQAIGVTSPPRSVTLKSTGSGTLTISNIATSGDYSETDNCPRQPNGMGQFASCTIQVTFTPTATGTRPGSLTVSDNAGTQSTSLIGTGVALSSWSSIAANMTSAPAVASWAPGRLDVFARGQDNALYHTYTTNGGQTWVYWQRIPANMTSAPTAVSWGTDRIDVFARGTDNALYHTYTIDGGTTWVYWTRINANMSSAPAVASWGPNRLDVFARGQDLALYHTYSTNGGTTWIYWERLGASMTSDPAAVSAPGSNRIDVFARGNDNAVYRRTYDTVNGWQYWVRIGGNLGSGPGAASCAAGRLDVLALGQDGALYHTYSTDGGASWIYWERFGGSWTSAPAVVAPPTTHSLEIFERGTDNALYHATLTS